MRNIFGKLPDIITGDKVELHSFRSAAWSLFADLRGEELHNLGDYLACGDVEDAHDYKLCLTRAVDYRLFRESYVRSDLCIINRETTADMDNVVTKKDYWIVGRQQQRVAGFCFVSLPSTELPLGIIGYEVLPNFQSRGYATDAAKYISDFLLDERIVETVAAQTLEDNHESMRVLNNAGFFEVERGVHVSGLEDTDVMRQFIKVRPNVPHRWPLLGRP